MLTGETNLIRAGRRVLELGPKLVIVKKGEHGSFLFSNYFQYALPAYPTDRVVDPTGAGDSFAGGMMGYIASSGLTDFRSIQTALAWGTVTASFTLESFGLDTLARLTKEQIEARMHEFQDAARVGSR